MVYNEIKKEMVVTMMPSKNFPTGLQIKALCPVGGNQLKNQVGKIIRYSGDNGYYLIKFSKEVKGHNEDACCFWVKPHNLIPWYFGEREVLE